MDPTMKARLEDVLDAADRARTKLEIAAMQLVTMGLKDDEAVSRLRTASSAIREARTMLIARRTA
jgi:hypothetical protein